ncbi:MAG: dUTP diphosphatase [Phycisphaerales bacterium]|nr:dUTP diphosphatase [Phycisphaerales bacterium]
MSITIRFQRLSPLATIPSYQSANAAGMDLHAAIPATINIGPGEILLIPCGFAMALPHGFEAQVRPRSGLATKYGISMPNTPGTVDADYRGEMKVPLINHSRSSFAIEPNMRVAQMVIARVEHAVIEESASLEETARGGGGFGSTGH